MSFRAGWDFAELHMPAIRTVLKSLPSGYFLDFATAPAEKDTEEATDLVLSVSGGTMGVRVRSAECWGKNYSAPEWSVRWRSRMGKRTEIDKLRDGFGDWYLFAYSSDDKGGLASWFLVDLMMVRDTGILYADDEFGMNALGWQGPWPNGDGSAGIYFPMKRLEELGCIMDAEWGQAP